MDYNFTHCFEKLSGIAHTVNSDQAAAEEIAAICKSHGTGKRPDPGFDPRKCLISKPVISFRG